MGHNRQHVAMEKDYRSQQEIIDSLRDEMREKDEKISKYKKQRKSIKLSPSKSPRRKRSKSPNKGRDDKAKSNAMIEAKKMSRSKSPIMHKKSYSVAVENRLQSELVSKLNKMNVTGTN